MLFAHIVIRRSLPECQGGIYGKSKGVTAKKVYGQMKPRLIDIYITADLFPVFGVSVAVFSLIFLSNQILKLTNFIVNNGVAMGDVVLMLAYSTPGFLIYVVPISAMIAVLLVFMRMAGDNELVALRSAGVSLFRLLYPVFFFCFCACLFTLFMTTWGGPRGKAGFKQLAYKIIETNPGLGINEREFVNSFKDMTIYVGHLDKKTRTLSNIMIQDRRTAQKPMTICAPHGRINFSLRSRIFSISLSDGTIHQVDLRERLSRVIRFNDYMLNININRMFAGAKRGTKDEGSMLLGELVEHIRKAKKKGSDYVPALMKLHKKFSIPFACIVLGLLAVPLGVRTSGRKASSGIGISLFFFLVYYLLLSLGQILGGKGVLPPWAGMWLPDMAMGCLGV
ncbi:MAG: LPS export ABC transporter permease LptF [Desulfococcus sp. 4484_241]|nr:MAG: LPS export ABC transporter permease LptF [Desulfococcus sp. 4484_241]